MALNSPVLAAVSYSNGRLNVNWIPISDSTFFIVSVFLENDLVNGASIIAQGFGANYKPNPALGNDKNYIIKCAQCTSDGTLTSAYSLPLNVLQNPLSNVVTKLNTKTLLIEWTLSEFGNPQGAEIALHQEGVSLPLISIQAPGASAILQLPEQFSKTETYEVYLNPYSNDGGSQGVNMIAPILTEASQIGSVVYSAISQEIQVYTNPPYPIGIGLYLTLYKNDTELANSTSLSNMSAFVSLIWATVDFAAIYSVAIRQTKASAYGPESQSVDVALSKPVLQSISFIKAASIDIQASWVSLPTRHTMTGGELTVLGDGQGVDALEVRGQLGVITLPITPAYSKYQLTVNTLYGMSTGPQSELITLLSVEPSISSIQFDVNILKVVWNEITDAPGYLLKIFNKEGQQIKKLTSLVAKAEIFLDLDPDARYSASVSQHGLIGETLLTGPFSASAPIISVIPTVTHLKYSEGKTTVIWNADELKSIEGISGYEVGLYIDKDIQGTLKIVEGADTNTTILDLQLEPWKRYVIKIRAIGTNCIGSFSIPELLITGNPVITLCQFDGKEVTVDWEKLPDSYLTGYTATLYLDKTTPVVKDTLNTFNNTAVIVNTLTEAGDYYVVVQGVTNKAIGPKSILVDIITAKTTLTKVNYDGEYITASWVLLATTTVTGYQLAIFDGTTLLDQVVSEGNNAVMRFIPDVNTSYQLRVQAIGQGAKGPWGDAADLLIQSTQITSSSYVIGQSPKLTINWKKIEVANTNYKIKLYREGIEITGLNPTIANEQATLNITLDNWAQYTVTVIPVNGTVNGPPSPIQALISATVEVGQVSFDGETIEISWEPTEKAINSGYSIMVYKDGEAFLEEPVKTNETHCNIANALSEAGTYTVKVQAISANVTGPEGAATGIIKSTTKLNKVSYDGHNIIGHWDLAADAVVNGYNLGVFDDTIEVAHIKASSTSASLAVYLDSGINYTVKIQALGLNSKGSWSLGMAILSAVPTITLAQFTTAAKPKDSSLTLNWSVITGADNYIIKVYQGDKNIAVDYTVTDTSAIITMKQSSPSSNDAFDIAVPYMVSVLGTITSSVTGPPSTRLAFITAQPVITKAIYNGIDNIYVKWGAMQQESVSGYLVNLYESGNANPIASIRTITNSIQWKKTLTEGTIYTIKVSALGILAIGPPSESINPNQEDEAYFFSAYEENVLPYIYRSGTRPAAVAQFILYLPQLFNVPPATLPPALTDPTDPKSPFVISVTTDKAFPYKLTVKTDSNAWLFNASITPIRSTLKDNYIVFIKALETVLGGLIPGAIPLIQQIIARSFPLTYSETLYYGYGYDPANRYCSLQAGMRVRIDYEMYQFSGPGGTAQQNGMVGNSTGYYQLGSYLLGASQANQSLDLGFNSFLSAIPISVPPAEGGGAGMLDTYLNGFRKPYLRIFYPSAFESADNPGWTSFTKNIALVAADSMSDMEDATKTYIETQNFPSKVNVTFFRGRVAIVPEVRVQVDNIAEYVAIGTSFRQLWAQRGGVPLRAKSGAEQTLKLTNFTFERSTENIINDLGDLNDYLYPLNNGNEILFNQSAVVTYSNGKDYFDLPMMQGDKLIINQG